MAHRDGQDSYRTLFHRDQLSVMRPIVIQWLNPPLVGNCKAAQQDRVARQDYIDWWQRLGQELTS